MKRSLVIIELGRIREMLDLIKRKKRLERIETNMHRKENHLINIVSGLTIGRAEKRTVVSGIIDKKVKRVES